MIITILGVFGAVVLLLVSVLTVFAVGVSRGKEIVLEELKTEEIYKDDQGRWVRRQQRV